VSSSPLLPYYNGLLLSRSVSGSGISVSNGRITTDPVGSQYLIKVFISRKGAINGVPNLADEGEKIVGASGYEYNYKGYALSVADVSSGFELDSSIGLSGNISGLTFTDIDVSSHVDYLGNGLRGNLLIGLDKVLRYQILNTGGVYNGSGIDELIYTQIRGVPIELQVSGVYV
jgi:hypothetical protein